MLAYPELIATTVEYTRNDADGLFANTHHGEIGVEAAVLRQPGGVDRATNGHVDLVDGEVVGERNRSGAFEFIDLEGAEIDHAAVLAEVQVFANGDGIPPTVVPFDLTLAEAVALDEVGVRVVPLGTFPDASLEEFGAKVFLAASVRPLDEVTTIAPLLRRVDDAVGLDE